MEDNVSGRGDEKGWGVAIFFLILLAIIVWSIRRGMIKTEESGYETKDLWAGQNVIKVNCLKEELPKVLPPNTVAFCIDEWEALEQDFRNFYKALDKLEEAKKTGDQVKIREAKSKVWDAGHDLNVGISDFDGDNNMWFIKVNEILLNLDRKISKN
jgi:hypothetical protein